MTADGIRKLLSMYMSKHLWNRTAKKYDPDDNVMIGVTGDRASVGDHLAWMCGEMLKITDESKLNRWFGFVQGVLWVLGHRTINELREDVIGASKA